MPRRPYTVGGLPAVAIRVEAWGGQTANRCAGAAVLVGAASSRVAHGPFAPHDFEVPSRMRDTAKLAPAPSATEEPITGAPGRTAEHAAGATVAGPVGAVGTRRRWRRRLVRAAFLVLIIVAVVEAVGYVATDRVAEALVHGPNAGAGSSRPRTRRRPSCGGWGSTGNCGSMPARPPLRSCCGCWNPGRRAADDEPANDRASNAGSESRASDAWRHGRPGHSRAAPRAPGHEGATARRRAGVRRRRLPRGADRHALPRPVRRHVSHLRLSGGA